MARVDQPPANHRRWFRFSLRTLLVLVALAAVASWGYWVAWPWWQIHQEELEFERRLCNYHVGQTAGHFKMPDGTEHIVVDRLSASLSDDGRNWFRAVSPNFQYIVCATIVDPPSISPTYLYWPEAPPFILELKAYKLPISAADYQAFVRCNEVVSDRIEDQLPAPRAGVDEFLEMTAPKHSIVPGFQYELIYSDPPATRAAK